MNLLNVMDGIKFICNYDLNKLNNIYIKDIAYNSNKAKKDYIFVCIEGETLDGHKYAKEAYKSGCRIFISQKYIDVGEDSIIFIVENSRKTLSKISANFFNHPSKELKVIGVTGTKGKTTISNYIQTVLNKSQINTGLIGTNGVFYNDIFEKTNNTTPESYELHKIFRNMINNGIEYVVMEVSSGGIMMDRVNDVNFDIGIFSNLSKDHIGPKEHPTFEHYLECKAKLFTMCKHGIINIDDKYSKDIISKSTCTIETFAIKNYANFYAKNIKYSRNIDSLGASFECICNNENIDTYICSPGEFSIYNALAVIAVCKHIGLDNKSIINALKVTKVKGRVEVLSILDYATIVIDYAHNGLSLKNILKTLKKYEYNRLICLFGSVGGRSKLRRKELGDIASKECDLCILTSDNPDFEDPIEIIKDISDSFKNSKCEYIIEPDRKIAIEKVIKIAKDGDMILFAGKGHEEYQLIKGEQIPFNEINIAKNAAEKITKTRQNNILKIK